MEAKLIRTIEGNDKKCSSLIYLIISKKKMKVDEKFPAPELLLEVNQVKYINLIIGGEYNIEGEFIYVPVMKSKIGDTSDFKLLETSYVNSYKETLAAIESEFRKNYDKSMPIYDKQEAIELKHKLELIFGLVSNLEVNSEKSNHLLSNVVIDDT